MVTIKCVVEADQEIAKACCRLREAGRSCFILATDSDFFLFRGVAYIVDTFQGIGGLVFNANNEAMGRVWTRKRLSETLGVEEPALVSLALLLGNDFTGHLDVSEMIAATANSGAVAVPARRLDAILEWIQEPGTARAADPGLVRCKDPEAQRYVDFSRKLYELESLEEFAAPAATGASCSSLASGPQNLAALEEFARICDDEHGTIGEMLRGKQAPASWLSNPPPPVYEDVVGAQRYLSGCRQLIRDIWALNREHGLAPKDPSTLFNGLAYHYLCQRRRALAGLPSGSGATDATDDAKSVAEPTMAAMPIDAHRDRLLKAIDDHAVTIIQGETGCGKSSRVPLMLLEAGGSKTKLFVAQPRRIAAHALMKRARDHGGLGMTVGLRLGHGIRDDSAMTKMWYAAVANTHCPHC